MNHTPIYITRDDYAKLRLLLASMAASNGSPAVRQLGEELDRATVIDPSATLDGIVTMDSSVEHEDVGTGEVEEYTITFPDRANIEAKRLSILAPIGVALIGCRVGDTVNWSTPGGLRQLKIRRVTPASAAPYAVNLALSTTR